MTDDSNRDDSLNRAADASATQRVNESTFFIGLRQRCPACGKGKLYKSLLDITEQCTECGLDLSARDPGDGPAFFVITLMGLVVVLLAIWLHFAYHPAYWVQASIWIPFTLVGSVYLLRLTKSLLIAYQYYYKIGFK